MVHWYCYSTDLPPSLASLGIPLKYWARYPALFPSSKCGLGCKSLLKPLASSMEPWIPRISQHPDQSPSRGGGRPQGVWLPGCCWPAPGNSLISLSRVFSDGGGGGVWVYWGKLGHLKTSSQKGTVLGPGCKGTQGVRWEGQSHRKYALAPFTALGRCWPYLSPGGCPTVLNFLAQSKEGDAVNTF